MACSHEGDAALAKVIIDAVGKSGAQAIQFQVWQASDLMVPYHSDFPRHEQIELSRPEWSELAHYTRTNFPDLEIIACVYERASVDFCEELGVDAYKVHTSDLSNRLLLEHVAQTGKRIDLSVGASTLGEIQDGIERIKATGNSNIWLMYGMQNFPTPPDEIHLSYMNKLKALFELPVGYQDHCAGGSEEGLWLPAASIGMGIDIQEKHITHDRSFCGVDHEAALNPDEFSQFVRMVRQIDSAKGISTPKPFSEEEHKYRRYAKKRMVASRNIAAGTTIGETDILFMRTETLTMTPDQVDTLLGKTLKKDLKAFEAFLPSDID